MTSQLGDISLTTAIVYGLLISLLLIVTRLVCTLGASVFTTFMSRFITVADAHPGWRGPFVLGWAGMRGVVSLAMALSIPVLLANGEPFPYRNLILFITFIVILVTLVFQGLTLPWLIRNIKLPERPGTIPEHKQEVIIQKKIAHSSLEFLRSKYGATQNEHLDNLAARLQLEMNTLTRHLDGASESQNPMLSHQGVYLEMLDQQRNLLKEMNRRSEFDEDLIRKYQGLIDIEEHKIREKQLPA